MASRGRQEQERSVRSSECGRPELRSILLDRSIGPGHCVLEGGCHMARHIATIKGGRHSGATFAVFMQPLSVSEGSIVEILVYSRSRSPVEHPGPWGFIPGSSPTIASIEHPRRNDGMLEAG